MAISLKYFIEAKDKSGKAAKSAEKNMDDLAKSVNKVAKAMALGFAADQIMDVARLGATAERVERRFEAFAKEAGGATVILDAFQKGAGGAASKMDAMASASKLLQMGLVEDAAKMERVVEMATRMGDQTQGVSDRVADFALMLANTSIPRLDNFGISSGKVRARIAELTTGVDAVSRETAFMTAVMEEGGQALEKLGPRADDNLMSFEKMEAQMADLKVEIGQALLPAMTSLVGVLSDVLVAAQPLIDAFAELTKGLGEMDAAIASTEATAAGMGDAFTALVAGGMETDDALVMMAASIDEANDRLNNLSATEKAALNLLGKRHDATSQVRQAQISLNESIARGSNSYKDYTDKIKVFNKSTVNSESRIDAMTQANFQWQKSWQAGTTALTEHEQAGLDMMSAVVDQYGEYTWANAQAYAAQQKQIEATQQHQVALEAARPAWITMNRVQDGFAQLAETGTARVREREQALGRVNQSTAASSAVLADAAKTAEYAATAESTAARAAEGLARAQQAAAEAATAHATEQGKLMVAMAGATEEQFKQAVFAEIDPAEIGIEAYANLGQELGILDEKSANLATAIPILADAYTDGIIPTENMAEATTALFEAAGDADFSAEALLDKYAKAPGLIGPSKDAVDDFATQIVDMGENIGTGVTQLNELAGAFTAVNQAAAAMPSIPSVPATNGVPSFQSGGIMPGVPGGPHALALMKPGERAVPVGMSAGPYGPPMQSTITHNTYHVPSLLAAKMLANQQSAARRARFEGR